MLDAEQDTLFAAPREAFVAERQRLVRALKQAGRAQEAAELARTPKPTMAAWTVNQLARQRRPLIKQLGAAGARLRDVQLGGAGGGGGAAEARQAFTQAVAAQREALSALRAAAAEILAAAGSGAPPHLLEIIVRTLRAGGASDIAQATIEQGRLLRDLEEQDLAALAAALPSMAFASPASESTPRQSPGIPETAVRADAPPAARADERAKKAEEKAQRAAEEAAARAAAQAKARARADAQRAVTERQHAAEKTAKEAVRYADEVARARAILADAERRLQAARAAHESAAGRQADAERALRDLS
ncbi:MAG TPA: hypothetical protein VH374_17650 [Polyangia bacterium]|jgi:hypothetical protein|nr:hypothetical protein [Polyangia bacterium]